MSGKPKLLQYHFKVSPDDMWFVVDGLVGCRQLRVAGESGTLSLADFGSLSKLFGILLSQAARDEHPLDVDETGRQPYFGTEIWRGSLRRLVDHYELALQEAKKIKGIRRSVIADHKKACRPSEIRRLLVYLEKHNLIESIDSKADEPEPLPS